MYARISVVVACTSLLVGGTAVPQEAGDPNPRPCTPSDSSTTDGKLAGVVRYGSSGVAAPGARTLLYWTVERDGYREGGPTQTVADAGGRFWFCEVPSGTRVTLEAEAPNLYFGSAALVMPDGFAHQDLSIRKREAGPGDLAVLILDRNTRQPVQGAVFRLLDVERGTVTDEDGRARLRNLPAGTHEYEVQHIRYGVQADRVEVRSGHTHALKIQLAARALALEPITVTVEFRPEWLVQTGFYWRQENGFGYYLSPEEIERRNPLRFSHLVEMAPGVRLVRVCNPHCQPMLTTNLTRNRMCSPEIYMDGRQLRLPYAFDLDAVPVGDIAAMEMYTGISQTPAEFFGLCGSLVIWTKRRNR